MEAYASKGKIALITPAPSLSTEIEFHMLAPVGVAIGTTRILLESSTPESLKKIADRAVEAARLAATFEPNVIILACTAGSFINGLGYDEMICKKIKEATGVTGMTTSTAVLQALQKLKVKKLTIATPYIDSINDLERKFFEDNGFDVVSIGGLQLGQKSPREMPNMESETMYKFVKKIFNEKSDALFISCTGISVIDIIDRLEKELGTPVVTSNQASLWACLQAANIKESIKGYGKLLQEP